MSDGGGGAPLAGVWGRAPSKNWRVQGGSPPGRGLWAEPHIKKFCGFQQELQGSSVKQIRIKQKVIQKTKKGVYSNILRICSYSFSRATSSTWTDPSLAAAARTTPSSKRIRSFPVPVVRFFMILYFFGIVVFIYTKILP